MGVRQDKRQVLGLREPNIGAQDSLLVRGSIRKVRTIMLAPVRVSASHGLVFSMFWAS